jgi:TatD DNase family protein
MILFDTHCHLTDEAFADDVEEVIARAEARGVQRVVQACVDESDFPHLLQLADRHPSLLLPTLGIHPENMAEDVSVQLVETESLLTAYHDRIVAIGEVGLDLHWDRSRLEDQRTVLRTQVRWAIRYDLPLLLHIRDAMDEWLALLPELSAEAAQAGRRLRGIMHCYSGTVAEAKELSRSGNFLFGVGGTLTYKKSLVPEVVRALGVHRLVLETDAPYLAPVPHRGRRGEPSFVADTAAALASVLDLPLDTVADITTENARKLFRNV